RVRFVHDATVAHAAAFGDGDGIVVIAGTGSVAFGRAGTCRARVGGWGPTFGDRGSAFWFGRHAIAAAMEAHDRERASPLPAWIYEDLGAGDLRAVQHGIAAGSISAGRIAALAEPLLMAAAADPEGEAAALAGEAVAALWELAALAANRVGAVAPREVGPSGGLFASAWFAERFRRAAPAGFVVVAPRSTPAQGALGLAYADAGLAAGPRRGGP
ncbi:MAG: BadF/BadG/BcrA/BcrD ATPase family protein, partial [Candidatus Baltobacteraceae bacterium]